MNYLCYFLFATCFVLLSSSCQLKNKSDRDISSLIAGDWLILYPKHELKTDNQRKVYGKAQDSIVSLSGLKTVRFYTDGKFEQTDSIFGKPGFWGYSGESKKIFIGEAGKGFDHFEGNLLDMTNDTMRIRQMILLEGEPITVVWHLKRITDKKISPLFTVEGNSWRQRKDSETSLQIQQRVKSMLSYYSLYFEMVSKESAYFTRARILLPFNYYQHAMGLMSSNEANNFNRLFNNISQAKEAYEVLSGAMKRLEKENFPSGATYVIEYSKFMQQLAGEIE